MTKFEPNKIIVHHSLTKDGQTVSWGAIRKYHMSPPPAGPADGPYINIGYHAGIELVGDHYEAFFGRPWQIPGAHCKETNSDSLGICFVGNYDEIEPPDEMLEAGAIVIYYWMIFFKIPNWNIYRHHDFNKNKTCPGTKFDLDRLVNKVFHYAKLQIWGKN